MTDALDADITAAGVRALRRRADAIRKRASVGVSVLDRGRQRSVIVITSESACALRIARDLDRVAADLEAESRT